MPLLFSHRSLSPVLLWWRSGGSGVLSLCFSCCQRVCTRQAACHTASMPSPPPCHPPPPPSSFSLLAPLNHNPYYLGVLLESCLHLGPLSPRCHFCHWISCWLLPRLPMSFVLCPRINSELPGEWKGKKKQLRQLCRKKKENRSRSWKATRKKKRKKKMSLNVSYATISIPLAHFSSEGDTPRHTEVGILVWKQ